VILRLAKEDAYKVLEAVDSPKIIAALAAQWSPGGGELDPAGRKLFMQ
jgi:hypothetical protein